MGKYMRKWRKGRRLTPHEALAEICAGNPVYWQNKWVHNSWARGWQIAMVMGSAGKGAISEAIKNEEETE